MKSFTKKLYSPLWRFAHYGKFSLPQSNLNTFFQKKFEVKVSYEDKGFQEVFELKDKLKYLSYFMVSKDISDVGFLDMFKDNYQFTAPYSRVIEIVENKEMYFRQWEKKQLPKEELEDALTQLKEFARVYETVTLLNSFCEELRLFNARLYVNPQKRIFKSFFVRNFYDTPEKMKDDLNTLINNYVMIDAALEEYPVWKEKFSSEVSKLFAFSNILKHNPEIYSILSQQKLFK
mmetsp:Transcript_29353/g.30464  ORF Transcript_29353/g.30464 Transcript_29353/m.30464 type:complete len:233 (-) Transcript_29353:95-793(-)